MNLGQVSSAPDTMDGLVPGFTALSLWEAEIIPPQEPLENGLEQLVIMSLPELWGTVAPLVSFYVTRSWDRRVL